MTAMILHLEGEPGLAACCGLTLGNTQRPAPLIKAGCAAPVGNYVKDRWPIIECSTCVAALEPVE